MPPASFFSQEASMLSAEFTLIPVEEIYVERSERIRREITDEAVANLADSIRRRGLIHPITITREGVLVAGETRLRACSSLGWSHIPAQYLDSLSAEDALSIELEENIKRNDLFWQDQCDALYKLHELNVTRAEALDEAWTVDDTARTIGYSPKTVWRQLDVARALAAGNPRVLAAKEFSTARNIVSRANERNAADILRTISLEDELELEDGEDPPEVILNESFLEWVGTYAGPTFSLIHCDFPYGIGADKFAQSSGGEHGTYEDTEEGYWALVEALCDNKDKLMGSSGHILFWFSMRHYGATLERLRQHFWVDPYPLIWHKSDNKGTLPDPQRGPRRVYEVAFLCSHGDRKIVASVANTFSGPTQSLTGHMSEKSEDMLYHFFRMLCDENSRVLDPTCGSGSALRAALRLGVASVLGLEINPEFAENARRSLAE